MPVPILPASDLPRLRQLLNAAPTTNGGSINARPAAAPPDQTRNYIIWLESALPAATEEDGVWTPGKLELPAYELNDDGELSEVLDEDDQPIKFEVLNIRDAELPAETFVMASQERYTGCLICLSGGSGGEEGNGGSGATDTICACNSSGLIGSGETEDGDVIAMAFSFPDPLGSILTVVVTRDEGADGVVYISDIYEYDCPPPPEEEEE